MTTASLNAVFEQAAQHAQPIGSEYLAAENLKKGQILNGFFVDYKEREIIDPESGEAKTKKAVSFMLLDEETKTIKRFINAGTVLCEAFGHGGIRPYTAVSLRYDGTKPAPGGKKTILWSPSILPVNLIDHLDKLPPLMQAMIDRKQVEAAALAFNKPQISGSANNAILISASE